MNDTVTPPNSIESASRAVYLGTEKGSFTVSRAALAEPESPPIAVWVTIIRPDGDSAVFATRIAVHDARTFAHGILAIAAGLPAFEHTVPGKLLAGATLGERIMLRRKSVGMNQDALAGTVGVGRSSIAQWETDRNPPTVGNLRKIAEVLKTTIYSLMGE
jgi:DNA-binding XRE family transcriptional regulator